MALTNRLDRGLVAPFLEEDGAFPPLAIDEIARAVAARFGIPPRDLRAATRRNTIVAPRHPAMHLARSPTGRSFRAIGAYSGGRDTKTVRHACRMAAARLAADPALAAAVDSLRLHWRSPSPADERPFPDPPVGIADGCRGGEHECRGKIGRLRRFA